MAFRITCISKDSGNHENPYVAISHLNWVNDQTGAPGRSTRLQMHDFLTGGGDAYVQAGSARANVIAAVSAQGTKYVKTRADNTQTDNLLKLAECR